MTKPLRLGLVGAGRWGQRYIATIAAIQGIELAAVASRNTETQRLVGPGCAVIDDWQQMLDRTSLDGLVVASPPDTHGEIAENASRRGLPVLVEKPLTTRSLASERLIETSERLNTLVMVEHTHLFSPAYRAFRDEVPRVGKLSRLSFKAGNQGPIRSDVTPLWDWAPHDLAMCFDLLAQLPVEVSVVRTGHVKTGQGAAESLRIELLFSVEIAVSIEVSNIADKKIRRLDMSGDRGSLVYDDVGARKVFFVGTDGSEYDIPFDPTMPLTCAVEEFCEFIRDKRMPHPSLRLGHDVVRILEICDRSLQNGVPVRVDRRSA